MLYKGRIVREGGPELVDELEAKGYGWITDEVEPAALERRRGRRRVIERDERGRPSCVM